MMASSWLIMTAAVSFSYASPLDHMHPLRYVTVAFVFSFSYLKFVLYVVRLALQM